MHKKHFFLSNNIAEARGFSPQNQGFGGHSLPTRDRAEHGQMVKGQYEIAVNQAIAHLEERENQGQPVANGIYVDLKMDKSFIPDSLGKQDSPKADLAEMDKIVVFPGPGWWKERKLNNVDNSVPYSLIVSIETKKTDIYNAVETAISNRIGVPIAQEV